MIIKIGYLYGDLMNTYGDTGNIITFRKRCLWRKITCQVSNISLGDKLKKGDFDLYFFGGGQDLAQVKVSEDLQTSGKAQVIKSEAERGVPVLSICGGYQLLGEYYQPHQGNKLIGVGLFPAYTEASFDRMIGNIVVRLDNKLVYQADHKPLNQLVAGFENHSGKTYLREGAQAFGKVIKGFGNNGQDKTSGCLYQNSIGCYLHGSLLPKNPQLADWLISKALEVKYDKKIELQPLDDNLENQAHEFAINKFS